MSKRQQTLLEIGAEIMHHWNAFGALTVDNPEAKTIMRNFMKAMVRQSGKDEAIRQTLRSVENLTAVMNAQDILFRVTIERRLPIQELEFNATRTKDLAPEYSLVASYPPHRFEQILEALQVDIKAASDRINSADSRPKHKDASLEPLNHALSEIEAELHILREIGK